MRTTTLGKTGLEVSRVVFGGIINKDETPEDARRFVEYAIENGVNYFDVAPSYGNAEERLGPALSAYRDQVVLACKTTERDGAAAKSEMLASLAKLQTDHFDVYQLHSLTTQEDLDRAFADEGAMNTLRWAKQEGLIHHIGFSAHSEEIALKALNLFDFETVLFPMYWAMGINTGWGDRISDVVKSRGIGLLAMKTLIHRAWRETDDRDTYPKSWCKPISGNDTLSVAAMKYGLYKGAATLVPPGNIEHFRFMVAHIDEVADAVLSDAEWDLLRREAALVKDDPIFQA